MPPIIVFLFFIFRGYYGNFTKKRKLPNSKNPYNLMKKITRREFIQASSVAAVAGTAPLYPMSKWEQQLPPEAFKETIPKKG